MPTKPPPLSLASRRALATLFDELLDLVDGLASECSKQNWNKVDDLVPSVKSYVRSIKSEIPNGLAKKQVSELDRHAQFIETWAKKRDQWYVLGNARAIRPDIRNLASAMGIGGREELHTVVESLPDGIEKDLLDEAVRCLDAESPRAAVVMAVCALENLLRRVLELKKGDKENVKKLDFWKVIDDVAKAQGLSETEKSLLDQCRHFRNFAAHPSEYNYTLGEALAVIHLAVEQVKKWKQAGSSASGLRLVPFAL